jgi:hypothetical protein
MARNTPLGQDNKVRDRAAVFAMTMASVDPEILMAPAFQMALARKNPEMATVPSIIMATAFKMALARMDSEMARVPSIIMSTAFKMALARMDSEMAKVPSIIMSTAFKMALARMNLEMATVLAIAVAHPTVTGRTTLFFRAVATPLVNRRQTRKGKRRDSLFVNMTPSKSASVVLLELVMIPTNVDRAAITKWLAGVDAHRYNICPYIMQPKQIATIAT